jgi:hypothetical protein
MWAVSSLLAGGDRIHDLCADDLCDAQHSEHVRRAVGQGTVQSANNYIHAPRRGEEKCIKLWREMKWSAVTHRQLWAGVMIHKLIVMFVIGANDGAVPKCLVDVIT